MKGKDSLYPVSKGGRTDKATSSKGHPTGGGMAEKVQKNTLPKPNSGGFKEGFNEKNKYPWGC